ncbi:MAG: hypothetical protein ASARMPREDX12_003529 [Alectoria sarmentosa]|nr:MAG: hypothetical protein ASARMPREDX12_003529 [Alectoria sarmentosa]
MASSTVPPTSELLHIQNYWANMRRNSPIYEFLLSDISLVSASKGVVIATLNVKPCHLNSKGTLHGTVSACLTDWAGGLAIATHGREKTGVSTDIHTTFISTAKEGDVLEIEGRANKVGGTLAFTSVEIRKVGEDGASSVVSMGSHTKYVKQ